MTDLFDFDKPDDYAVMGNPINHSKSPQIHKAFAQQTGQNIRYTAIQVDPGGFSQAVNHFQGNGGKGLNITVPFKLEARRLADTLSDRARRAGAVNTLLMKDDGSLHGDNTDGVGLVSDIVQFHGWEIVHKRVLVLGAGGAARGVLEPLLACHPEILFIANRTASRAAELCDDFTDLGKLEAGGFDSLAGLQFDLVINATAASLQGEVPPLPDDLLSNSAKCYDMMYGALPTAFMHWAIAHNAAQVTDGLGMLVGQAAESFFLWRGVKPDVAPVIASIRQQMGN